MKKLSVFLPLCLSLFFFSCKSAPEPAPAPKPVTPEPAPVVKEDPPKPVVVEKPKEEPKPKEDPMAFPKGEWLDANWNAKWIVSDESLEIQDSKTNESIYVFTKDNIEDEDKSLTDEGLIWSFVCKNTYRKYYLTKFDSKKNNKNLLLQIDPDWEQESYEVELKKIK